jgi:hypothetical protein
MTRANTMSTRAPCRKWLALYLVLAAASGGCRSTSGGAARVPVASAETAATSSRVHDRHTVDCREDNPVPVRLVRLAQSELVAHLVAVLGDAVVRGEGAPVFYLQGDHTHPAIERVINSVDFGSYRNAARALARRYVQALPADAVCLDPEGALACSHGPLKTLMVRLHRGELDVADWQRIERVYARIAASYGPRDALEAMLTSALLSPAILYRAESGTPETGSGGVPREPATSARMLSRAEAMQFASFAVVGRAPEPAEQGELMGFPDKDFQPYLARMARQWTRTAAFQDRAADFVQDWLGVSHLREKLVRPGLTGGGEGKPDMSGVLLSEFNAFVKDHLLGDDGGFARFFTATQTRYYPALEDVYAGRFVPPNLVMWDERERKGVLGLAGLLAAHASEQASDPVQRGMLVRLRILCEAMPPPIPNADLSKVGITPQMQTRERFEALAAVPACRGCHSIINPPGYLFESFDQYGRFRTIEKGRPINDRGSIPAFFGSAAYQGAGNWSGIVDLADWLSQAPEPRLCFAREFSNYFLSARVFDRTEGCGLQHVASRFVKSGVVADLVEDLVRSEVFRRRVQAAR